MAIDIIERLTQLKQERYRTILIHVDPLRSHFLTQFAKKICQNSGGKYLDLLDTFIKCDELKNNIDRFGPDKLKTLLKDESRETSLMIIDRMDFLLDTWHRHQKQAFWRLVEDQWDGFLSGMKASLVFCLQSSDEIKGLILLDSRSRSRIYQLSDFNDIR